MNTGPCEFCTRPGPERAAAGEGGLAKPVYACHSCWKMLQDPKTALPLLRGNVSLGIRGKVPEDQAKRMIDQFMERVSGWKPRD